MLDVIAYGISGFALWLLGLSAWHKVHATAFFTELAVDYLGGTAVKPWQIRALALIELLVAALLLLPATRVLALGAAAAILLGYALLMLLRLLAGQRDMRCGCAGPASEVMLSPLLIVRNIVCALLCLGAVPLLVTPLGPVLTALLSFTVSLFLIALYICCEYLLSNAQQMARGI